MTGTFGAAEAQSGAGGASEMPAKNPPQLVLKPCRHPELEEEVRCGTYEVFEDRAARRGRRIPLSIVVLPAKGTDPAPDPLFLLAGGPGQAATKLADFAAEHFGEIRRRRDVVLLDQRGTGQSNPLRCALWDTDPLGYFGELFPIDSIRRCRAELEKRADLKLYTTPIAMDDLDEVREALGYERINIYGTSYGTRAALVYMRQYPARVRSVVLKGVSPMSLTIPVPFARDTQSAMDRLFEDCSADAQCRATFPNLRAEFQAVLDSIRKGKAHAEAEHPVTKQKLRVEITPGMFSATLRSILQSNSASAQIPLMIQQAARGDYGPLAKMVALVRRGLTEELSYGMFLTVTGAEDVPLIDAAAVERETKETFMGDYWVRQLIEATKVWPRAKVPNNYHEPVRSDAPVLLLSGVLDPATPPRWAEEAARHLPNSLQVTIRNASHSYGGLGPCVDNLMGEFVAKGSVRGLDTSCTAQVRRPQFILRAEATK
jgi:pimeloyl-ACP methyl ester carboxylesterase